jgi:hypothetical protein
VLFVARQKCNAPSVHLTVGMHDMQGRPEPYIYTVYDRTLGNFPAKCTVYTPYIYDIWF